MVMKVMNMKARIRTIPTSCLIGGLAFAQTMPAGAIEPLQDNPTPPAALLQVEAPPIAPRDDTPFFGVATVEVPGMLADHLGLGGGTGVIIRTVCPDSPAEKAGLSVNDIIVSLDGTATPNPEAFSAVIGKHKAGETLSIDLIHKGKTAKAEVILSEKPSDLTTQPNAEPFLEGIPKIHADRLRGLIEQNLGAFGAGQPDIFPDAEFEETFRLMRERMNRPFNQTKPLTPGQGGGIGFQQNSTIRLMDGDGSVEINSSNGDTQVKVRGTDNKVIWSGPWNSDADKEAAPNDIRERIEKANTGKGTGFSFRFGKMRGEPDTIDN
jgi:serine protease Do